MANQKLGIAMPIWASPMMPASLQRRWRAAANTPPAAAEAPTAPRFHHPRTHRQVTLGEHRVGYEFRRAKRRSIGFVVGAEGPGLSDATIDAARVLVPATKIAP